MIGTSLLDLMFIDKKIAKLNVGSSNFDVIYM